MSHFHNNALIGASGQGGGYNLESSLRLRASASPYLTRTPTTAGNRKTWTYSAWVKLGIIGNVNHTIFSVQSGVSTGTPNLFIWFRSAGLYVFQEVIQTSTTWAAATVANFRDPSAWYHVVVAVDTTQATSSNRIKMYVNGVEQTLNSPNYPSQNYDTLVNSTTATYIGRSSTNGSSWDYFDGYLTEVNFVDGQALTPSDFGETDTITGVWKPKEYTGTYGTNGFYLDFSEKIPAYNIQAYGNTQHDTAQSNIGGSSIYFDGSGDYLDLDTNNLKMLDSIGTGDFTIEFWIRYASVNSYQWFIGGDTSNMFDIIQIPSNLRMILAGTEYTFSHSPSTNTWYHYAVSRNNGSLRAFVNGTQIGTTQSSSDNINGESLIAGKQFNDQYQFNGWLDEIRLSNSARYTSNFTAPTTTITSDSNTILLIHSDTTDGSTTFTDSSGIGTGSGTDQSGNGNNFIPNNINTTNSTSTTYDLMNDVPTLTDEDTGNFATWNPLVVSKVSPITYSNGNQDVSFGSSLIGWTESTIGVSSGKWYAEIKVTAASGIDRIIGISTPNTNNQPGYTADSYGYYGNGQKINNNSLSAYGASYTTGDVIGIALDLDAGTLTFYKNGTSQGTAFTGISGTYLISVADSSNAGTCSYNANFGQRPFAYTPPTGYKKLNTYNL